MADRIEVRFKGDWAKLARSLTKREWEKKFAIEAGRATKINSLIARRAVRKAILHAKAHGATKSAGLTIAIKGQDTPLHHFGEMHGAVTTRIDAWHTVSIGILRTAGPDLIKIATFLHEGTGRSGRKITDEMRGMFAVLHAVSLGHMDESKIRSARARKLWHWFSKNAPGEVWPSLKNKTIIVVPGRPFLEWAVKSPEMTKVGVNYAVAALRAFIVPGMTKGAPKYVT